MTPFSDEQRIALASLAVFFGGLIYLVWNAARDLWRK